MQSDSDWVTDVRRWINDRARLSATDVSSDPRVDVKTASDGVSEFGYEAADSAVAGAYGYPEQAVLNADGDAR